MTLAPSESATRQQRLLTPVLFTATIFLSASLLFFVQPLFTKIVLPHIGGAPAVWTTAMLFFQTILIAGYVYAHLSTRYLPVRAQMVMHLALWALALLFLPLSVAESWRYDPEAATAWQTLKLYAMGVGLPFAVLSANAPLIQSWYGQSGGPNAQDPYFLYGASNLGSLIALLGFPLLAEPFLGAGQIGIGWAAGFVVLGAALLASGWVARHGQPMVHQASAVAAPRLSQIARWLGLAFVPSSLMLVVTTKISTDLGAIPLIWVVPLSLYLLTFVLAFTNRPLLGLTTLRTLAVAGLGFAVIVFSGVVGGHLAQGSVVVLVLSFFALALFSHRKLYEARPDSAHLTVFYVTMSVGGALGGLFNSILAPSLFDTHAEAPLTLIAAALVFAAPQGRRIARFALPGLLAGGALFVVLLLEEPLFDTLGKSGAHLLIMMMSVLALLMLRRNGAGVITAVLSLLMVGAMHQRSDALLLDRSFFGAHRVTDVETLRLYTNGTTIHGAQRIEDLEAERPNPLYYYHKNGPMGQILSGDLGAQARSVGVVGLGVGALSCYRRDGQDWHFYEIDRVVDQVARNPAYFTFMSRCAGDSPTHLGDARVVLDQQDLRFDVLVIDAYSSDAVPVHLTTHEAMDLYLQRLNPGGVLIYHISNRYYAIERPLARSATAHGLEGVLQHYKGNWKEDPGDTPSTVAVFGRTPESLQPLSADPRWQSLISDGGRIWTDDHANLLSILK